MDFSKKTEHFSELTIQIIMTSTCFMNYIETFI